MKYKKVKLFSLHPEEYPDLEIEFKIIDDMKTYAENLMQHFPVQFAQKTAQVKARKGKLNEEVDTRARVLHDGRMYVMSETKNKVTMENSMIVTNPDGEEYILKPEKFALRYDCTHYEDIYAAKSDVIQFVYLNENIVFQSPWCGDMFAHEGAALNVTHLNDIYCIQNCLFDNTYSIVNKTL